MIISLLHLLHTKSYRTSYLKPNRIRHQLYSTSNNNNNINIKDKELNEFVINFINNFYYQGAARIHYLKNANRSNQITTGSMLPQDEYNKIKNSLNKSVIDTNNNEQVKFNIISNNAYDATTNNIPAPYQGISISYNANNSPIIHTTTANTTNTTSEGLFDVVLLNRYLSLLPTPEERLQYIINASHTLTPSGYNSHPHRTGLLIIAEELHHYLPTAQTSYFRGSEYGSEKSTSVYHDLLNKWRQSIKLSTDLELIKQRVLTFNQSGSLQLQLFIFGKRAVGSREEVDGLEATTSGSSSSSSSTSSSSNSIGSIGSSSSIARKGLSSISTDFKPWILSDMIHQSSPTNLQSDSPTHSTSITAPTNAAAAAVTVASEPDTSLDYPQLPTTNTKKASRSTTTTTTPSTRAIADQTNMTVGIIGGGLGGTALALALQQRGIRVKIYEKDANFSARKQGYALTIQQGSIALKGLGLYEEVAKQGYLSLAHVSLDSSGAVVGSYGVSNATSSSSTTTTPPATHTSASASSATTTRTPATHTPTPITPIAPITPSRTYTTSLRHIHIIPSAQFNETIHIQSTQLNLNTDLSKRHNIHIPRQTLRHILLYNINTTSFIWSKKLVKFEEVYGTADSEGEGGLNYDTFFTTTTTPNTHNNDNSNTNDHVHTTSNTTNNTHSNNNSSKSKRIVKLYFDDNTTDQVDMLVAADGIHSTIRKQLQNNNINKASSSKSSNTKNTSNKSNSNIASNDDVSSNTNNVNSSDISVVNGTRSSSNSESNSSLSSSSASLLNYLGLIVVLGISPNVIICEHTSYQASGGVTIGLPQAYQASGGVTKGRHQVQWVDGKTRVFTMPYDKTHTMWQLSFHCDEVYASELTGRPEQLKRLALSKVGTVIY